MVDLIQEVLLNSYLDYFFSCFVRFLTINCCYTFITFLSHTQNFQTRYLDSTVLCIDILDTLTLSNHLKNTLWVNVDPVAVVVSLKILRKIHTGQRNNQLGMYWQNCQQSLISSNIFFRTKTELSVHFWSHNWRTTWATRRDLAASFV